MPSLVPYYLTFQCGFHIGSRGVNLEEADDRFPSDTLFSALVIAWLQSGEPVQQLLDPFLAGKPPFLISSSFPFIGSLRFYPAPVDLSQVVSADVVRERGKTIKRVRYISEGLLQEVLAGHWLDEWLFSIDADEAKGVVLQGGTFWLKTEEIGKLPSDLRLPVKKAFALSHASVWSEQTVQRVTVDRISSAPTLYQAGRTVFRQESGLWFGMEWQPSGEELLSGFELALAQLQHAGLGGERSSGYGAFEYQTGDAFQLPDPLQEKPAYLLSRYHPRQDELPAALSEEGTAYHSTAIGGWMQSQGGPAQRRKRVQLVSEGSLIAPPAYPAGNLADVTPEYAATEGQPGHRVYRYGYALTTAWPEREAKHA
jgi:CRISPR-associated protein Csm4